MSDDSDEWWAEVGLSGGDVSAICRIGYLGDLNKVWERVVQIRIDYKLQQGSDDWMKFRGLGIGSSDVGTILRKSSYNSVQSIYREKAGKKKNNNNIHYGESVDTARGKLNEPRVRQLYCDLYSYDMVPACIVHDTIPWARASLDGIRGDGKLIIEIKCPRSENFAAIKELGPEAITNGNRWEMWRVQLAYQMWIADCPQGHLVIYDVDSPGRASDRLLIFPVFRDIEFEEAMVERLTEFWEDYVLRGIEPKRGW